ncbi:hypothetical protein [Arcticibacter sp. MXS-1]|uniref:hypothetical protein n=1 Tax=Arcticibacter sp. MXS-1 TaxID=3341726 RepID=UPI0035A8949F
MIEFLKESTFAVNDVLRLAWRVLKSQYPAIAGLCLLSFITSMMSGFLSALFADFNLFLSIIMAFGFILLYFGIQFMMFKYILNILDSKQSVTHIRDIVPSYKHYVNFFIATFYFLLTFVIIFLVILGLVFIVDFVGIKSRLVVPMALSLTILCSFFIGIRISFFPFFIIDKDAKAFQSLKFSLAITRGNFTRVIMLLGFLALFHGISVYFFKQSYVVLGFLILLLNYSLIVPLSAVAIIIAYRKMMSEYDGDQDPEIFSNII